MSDRTFSEHVSILDREPSADDRNSLGQRIWDSWMDMRSATRRLIDEHPSEHRLLFYVLLSDIVFFLSWSLKTVVAPVSGVADYVPVEIGFWLIGALFMRTAAMYAFSLVLAIGTRLAGGRGTWRATRTAVFLGAIAAAPFGLLMALITIMMAWYEPQFPILAADWVSLPPYALALLPFLWLISQGVAEAQGYTSNRALFGVLSAVFVAGLAIIAAMGWAGII